MNRCNACIYKEFGKKNGQNSSVHYFIYIIIIDRKYINIKKFVVILYIGF